MLAALLGINVEVQLGPRRITAVGLTYAAQETVVRYGSLNTTQRYIHPDRQAITDAGDLLSLHLRAPRRGRLLAVR